MFRVRRMHLAFGSDVSGEQVANVGCTALVQAPWLAGVILRRPLTRVE